MNKRNVVAWRHLPVRWPIGLTILVWLLLDRFHPPEWLVGVVWTWVAFLWILAAFVVFGLEEKTEPLWKGGPRDV